MRNQKYQDVHSAFLRIDTEANDIIFSVSDAKLNTIVSLLMSYRFVGSFSHRMQPLKCTHSKGASRELPVIITSNLPENNNKKKIKIGRAALIIVSHNNSEITTFDEVSIPQN